MITAPLSLKEYWFMVQVLISCKNQEQEAIAHTWIENVLRKKYGCGPMEIESIMVDILSSVVIDELGDKID